MDENEKLLGDTLEKALETMVARRMGQVTELAKTMNRYEAFFEKDALLQFYRDVLESVGNDGRCLRSEKDRGVVARVLVGATYDKVCR